ncbi:DUF1254 domain-containing protein [Vibrio agarivorans]|uniref:DUF1254 domain-containing protein n=1 Tax=Vibrio agarivorans TaxID=153622 RepID=UPI002231444F|nr:DUF1254 domain-containing protein [Vibrio agarivorans]
MKETILITALATILAAPVFAGASISQADNSALATQNEQAAAIEEARYKRRAMEAGTWFMPQIMYYSMEQGAFETFGGDELTIYYYSKPMNWQARMVTGNNNSPYVHTYHDLSKTGPVVVEIPAATETNAFFGTFLDSWHKPIVDVGPGGEDRGLGGKYLVVPAGYEGDTEGYIVVEQETNKGYISIRSLTDSTSDEDMAKHVDYVQSMKMYPLGAQDTTTQFIDLWGKTYEATIPFDLRFWTAADYMVQNEVIKQDEKAFYGMMKSLGIEKGKRFNPSEKQVDMLIEAAKELHQEMMHDVAYFAPKLWPETSNWTIPVPMEMMTTNATYVSENWNDYQSRGATFYFYFAPPASLAESKSTTYIKGALDSDGVKLNGGSDYQIVIPADVPAKRFWSMLTYATKDGAYIENADPIGIASNESQVVINSDGTTTLTWSSHCEGKVNCMPVIEGEEFFTLFRLYGPEAAFFDKSFALPDIVKR